MSTGKMHSPNPYGLRVATGGGKPSKAAQDAAEKAGARADRLLDQLLRETSGKRR